MKCIIKEIAPILFVLLFISLVSAVSLQDAEEAFLNATLDVQQLKSQNLPVGSLEDALDVMDEKLYGENLSLLLDRIAILNASNESDKMALASQLSVLVQASLSSGLPVGVNYSFVVERALWVRSMRDRAFLASEALAGLRDYVLSLNVSGLNLSGFYSSVNEADSAFRAERYDDVFVLVDRAKSQLEDAQVEFARERAFMRLARRNVVDYVEDHWRGLLFVLAGLVVLGLWVFFEVRALHALRKVHLLQIELRAVEKALRSAQEEYYHDSIGATTYRVRMDAFKQKQRRLKTDIEVWRSLAKSYKKFTVFSRFMW